jgi:hypothetical protein
MLKMVSIVRPTCQATTVRWARRRPCRWAACAALWPCVAGAGGISWQAPTELARGGGERGSLAPRLDRDTWDNGSLDIVAAPGGVVIAAWTEYEGRLLITRSEDGGRSFSRPMQVAGAAPERPARAPALAVRGRDQVVLAWTAVRPDGEIAIVKNALKPGSHSRVWPMRGTLR